MKSSSCILLISLYMEMEYIIRKTCISTVDERMKVGMIIAVLS